MRRSNGRVRLWATGLAGIVAAALPLVSVRHAMGAGTIPPPCGMTLVLAKASPGVVLNRPGAPTTVTLPMLVYLVGAVEFGGVDFCLSPPFQRTIDLTVTCDPGPGTTVSVPVTLNAGFNEVPVTVTLPPGPARQCTVAGTVSITLGPSGLFPGGATLSAQGDTKISVGDPAPGNPTVPRLDLRHADASAQIARVHPGDQAFYTYVVTNNDPTATFTGTIATDMRNVSRLPTLLEPAPGFSRAFSVAGQGDAFPLAYCENLGPDGCVLLPADPLQSTLSTITKTITLGPGESIEVRVAARSWPLSANGSCGESTVVLTGVFSDGSTGQACAGAVYAVDTSCPRIAAAPAAGPHSSLSRARAAATATPTSCGSRAHQHRTQRWNQFQIHEL